MSVSRSLAVLAGGQLEDILLRQQRRIAAYIPQVVIEEQHVDDLFITSHPVDRRANITDHSVKMPAQLTMRVGSSASGAAFDRSTLQNIGTTSPTPADVYQMLRDLQASRVPFEVVTGKRNYRNMLIKRLTVTTDQESENALFVDIEMQEVILVSTTTSTIGASSSSLPGPFEDVPKDPGATTPPVNNGSKSAIDVTTALSPADAAYTFPLVSP